MSEERELRRAAYEQYYDTYGHFQNTAAAILCSEVKQRQFFATARKYDSPWPPPSAPPGCPPRSTTTWWTR